MAASSQPLVETMNLRFLETFVWVARLKSFSATAEKLNTTQAAVSHRIATLERELGVRLFERGTHDVRLTPQGINSLDHAEQIVHSTAEFCRRLSDPKATRSTVRIGIIGTIAFSWLPQFINRLNHTYPQIALELSNSTSIALAEDLLASRIDLALLMGPIEGPGVVTVDLCTFACAWVASPKLRIPAGPIEMSDLVNYPILSFPRNSRPYRAMLGCFQSFPKEDLRIYTAFLAVLIRLASDGLGVATLPVATIAREIADGTLIRLDVRQPPPSLSCHAVYQDSISQPQRGLLAELARDTADEYCRTINPLLAWRASA
jgi:DNA-binding transcriptional LysR family regulator